DGLAEAVAWVARSLPSRPPVPVLGGVLLDAGGDSGDGADTLTISGFDYEVSATAGVPSTIAEGGRTLVSGRLLADITKALPAQPELAGEVAGDAFAQAVAQVAVAAGKDDTLPMLTGMRVEITGSTLTLVATDRFRLAMREFSWQPAEGITDSAVLVPARTLADAAKSLGSAGTTVQIGLAGGDGLLGLSGGGKFTTTRLIDAEFPPYRQLLPSDYSSRAILHVPALTEAIKRVSLVAERGTQVRLEFEDGSLRLAAGGDDEGSAEEELPVDYEGEPVTIAFN